MPSDSAGNYTLPSGYLAVTGQTVLASQHNPPLEDLGSGMTARYMRDGRTPLLGNLPMNGYKATGAANGTDPQDYVTKSQLDAAIAAVAGIPTGAMLFLASTVVPTGWLALTGQLVSRTTFAALWAFAQASGNLAASEGAKTAGQFGPGDGSTTFSLPNLYADGGYFIRPITSGRGIGTVQADEFKNHLHSATFAGDIVPPHTHGPYEGTSFWNGSSGGFGVGPGATFQFTASSTTSPGGGFTPTGAVTVTPAGGSETRPKNIAYPVLIKA